MNANAPDQSCGRMPHHIFIHSYLIQTVCTKVLPYHFYIHVYYVLMGLLCATIDNLRQMMNPIQLFAEVNE